MKKLTNNLKQIHRKSKLTEPTSTARDALSCSYGCLVLISACHRWLSPAFAPRLAGNRGALVGGVRGYKDGMLLLRGSHLDLPGSSSRATRTLLLSCPTLPRSAVVFPGFYASASRTSHLKRLLSQGSRLPKGRERSTNPTGKSHMMACIVVR